jgi:RNase P protein component
MPSSKRLRRLARSGPWSLHQIDTINGQEDQNDKIRGDRLGEADLARSQRSGLSICLRISIAKRIIPLAVERNRLRRIVKESFRKRLGPQAQASAKLMPRIYLLRLDQSFGQAVTTATEALSTRHRKKLYWQSLEAIWQGL